MASRLNSAVEAPRPATYTMSSSASMPPVRRVRIRRRPACPDPDSLYDLLRRHCGASLFVLPILWTDLHPRVLGVTFEKVPAPPADAAKSPGTLPPSPSPALFRPSEMAAVLSADLSSLLAPEDMRLHSKSRAMKNVLATLFPAATSLPKTGADLDIHFGSRTFRNVVRVPVVWKSVGLGIESVNVSFDSAMTRAVSSCSLGVSAESAESTQNDSSMMLPVRNGPLLAYVNRSHLALIRRNLFRVVPGPARGDQANTPVSRLQCLRSKLLVPGDVDHDAYLVSIFLAMAQAHFYTPDPARTPAAIPAFRDVPLRIITHDDDAGEFIVYAATVPAVFLQRFAQPTVLAGSSCEAGLRITYTRVPVWPILGLRERLGHALGPAIAGECLDDGGLFREVRIRPACEVDEPDKATQSSTASTASTATEPTSPAPLRDTRKRKRTRTDCGPLAMSMAVSAVSSVPMVAMSPRLGGCDEKSKEAGNGSPVLSPRGKRRRTRSLSSSLAVF